MPTWDEITPYTERSTLSRHTSVTNATLFVHAVALGACAVFALAGWRGFPAAVQFQTLPAVFGLEAWRFISFPFAHSLDPASLASFVILGWLFLRAGNDLEREWGGGRMMAFCMGLALYGATAQAAYDLLVERSPLAEAAIAGGLHAPVLGVLLAHALRAPRRPVLFLMLVPMRAITGFWMVFIGTLTYGVFLYREGPSPIAMAGAVAAAWVYVRLDPKLDRFLEWLDSRRARAKFLEEFELRGQVDALLDKIQREGMASLTRPERRILRRASGLYRPPARPAHE